MNEVEQVIHDEAMTQAANDNDTQKIPPCDDRYPGSFFTIPAPFVLGKTAWSLN